MGCVGIGLCWVGLGRGGLWWVWGGVGWGGVGWGGTLVLPSSYIVDDSYKYSAARLPRESYISIFSWLGNGQFIALSDYLVALVCEKA